MEAGKCCLLISVASLKTVAMYPFGLVKLNRKSTEVGDKGEIHSRKRAFSLQLLKHTCWMFKATAAILWPWGNVPNSARSWTLPVKLGRVHLSNGGSLWLAGTWHPWTLTSRVIPRNMLLTMPKDTSMIKLVMDFKIKRFSWWAQSNHFSFSKAEKFLWLGSNRCSRRGRWWRDKADRFEGEQDLICRTSFESGNAGEL